MLGTDRTDTLTTLGQLGTAVPTYRMFLPSARPWESVQLGFVARSITSYRYEGTRRSWERNSDMLVSIDGDNLHVSFVSYHHLLYAHALSRADTVAHMRQDAHMSQASRHGWTSHSHHNARIQRHLGAEPPKGAAKSDLPCTERSVSNGRLLYYNHRNEYQIELRFGAWQSKCEIDSRPSASCMYIRTYVHGCQMNRPQ